MDEINNFLQRGNRKIVNIQVVKDFDTEVTGVNYLVFYEEGPEFTFWPEFMIRQRTSEGIGIYYVLLICIKLV